MRTLTSSIVLAVVLVCTGCNTVQGLGQDLQKAGEKIEDVAKKKK